MRRESDESLSYTAYLQSTRRQWGARRKGESIRKKIPIFVASRREIKGARQGNRPEICHLKVLRVCARAGVLSDRKRNGGRVILLNLLSTYLRYYSTRA